MQAFVRQAMGYIEQTPDKDTMVELIKTLQSVTEGKIYVEIERARLTRRLAKIKEAEGKIDEAADTLQEVAVVRPPRPAPRPPENVVQLSNSIHNPSRRQRHWFLRCIRMLECSICIAACQAQL